jgi:spore germination protein YaaH
MGSYIKITSDTPITRLSDGMEDERFAVIGKVYKLIGESSDRYHIRIGSVEGWISSSCAQIHDDDPGHGMMAAWDYIQDRESNAGHFGSYINVSSVKQGLDVISPTWFTRTGDADRLESIFVDEKCDREYVRIAHRNGYEVWGLIADFDYERNFTVYSNETLVSREIDDILKYALQYGLDGINIDFEGFGSRCRDIYAKYVKRLACKLKEHNLVVSIDVTKESDSDAWGKCYDRAELSKYVDYMAYMAYDENGRLDVVPGSTGSLPWVEEGITELMDMGIPREKILLGVPFYTRDWKVSKMECREKCAIVTKWEDIGLYEKPDFSSKKHAADKGSVLEYIGETGEWLKVEQNGREYYIKKALCTVLEAGESMYLADSVSPLPMKDIQGVIAVHEADCIFDDYAGQTRIIYTDSEGFKHFIWAEDEASMEKRLTLVRKYSLPGAAAWMLTHETDTIWDVVKKVLK